MPGQSDQSQGDFVMRSVWPHTAAWWSMFTSQWLWPQEISVAHPRMVMQSKEISGSKSREIGELHSRGQ